MSLLAGALDAGAVTDVLDDAGGLRAAARSFGAATEGVLDAAERAAHSWSGLPRVLTADALTGVLTPLMTPAVARARAMHDAATEFSRVASIAAAAIEDLHHEHDALVAAIESFHRSAPGRVASHVAQQAASGDLLGAVATAITSWRQVPSLVADEAVLRWKVQAHDDRVTDTMHTVAAQIGAIAPSDGGTVQALAVPTASVHVADTGHGSWFGDVLHGAEHLGRDAWHGVEGAAEAAWPYLQDAAGTVGNIGASFGNAIVNHPDEFATLIGGLAIMAVGDAIEGGGIALDLTVVGIPGGVALNVAGAGVIAAGGAMAMTGGTELGIHAMTDDSESPYETNHAKEANEDHPGRNKDGTYRSEGNGEARADSAQKEQQGLDDYAEETGVTPNPKQVTARVDGVTQGRRYDGLAEKNDGTYEGVEVKSGGASLTPEQREFDAAVNSGRPATATLPDGTKITITSVRRVNVP